MSINIEEMDRLLHVLRAHSVESFKSSDIEVKISPVKYIAEANVLPSIGSSEKITEDDLYYSASNLKLRAN